MVLFDLENLKIYHISLLFFNLQFLGSLEKCPGAQIKKKLDFKQEKALSSYSLSVVISVWTASPARKLCVILEARDEMAGSGNIADAYDNPLNTCFISHHPSHFTVTGHLSYVCQPFPSSRHKVGFD